MDRPQSRSLSLVSGLKQVYSGENNFSDLKLRSKDNMVISAHRLILAARSPFLKSLLEKECSVPKFDGMVEIESVNAKPLVSILHWMYTDELLPEAGKFMEEVTAGAIMFELTGLIELLDKSMISFCKPSNMFELFRVAEKYNMDTAIGQLAAYIKSNIDGLLPLCRTSSQESQQFLTSSRKPSSSCLKHTETTANSPETTPVEKNVVHKAIQYLLVIIIIWIVVVIFSSKSKICWSTTRHLFSNDSSSLS